MPNWISSRVCDSNWKFNGLTWLCARMGTFYFEQTYFLFLTIRRFGRFVCLTFFQHEKSLTLQWNFICKRHTRRRKCSCTVKSRKILEGNIVFVENTNQLHGNIILRCLVSTTFCAPINFYQPTHTWKKRFSFRDTQQHLIVLFFLCDESVSKHQQT